MKTIVLSKFQTLRSQITSTKILHVTEILFIIFPLLFLGLLGLISWHSGADIMEPVRLNPVYSLYFILFLSFFFCAFIVKYMKKSVAIKKNKDILKITALALILTQLFSMNLICGWLLLWFVKKEYGMDVFRISWQDLKKAPQKWILLFSGYTLLVSFFVCVIRFSL
ncbi:hypothetical protein [Listeria rocourtiae]|uniref:hypothetical protein n=1 Tax=Listeria rocourtiae TaxID=647910 RepID=UPI003D2F7DB7